MNNTRDKLRALLLATLMVTSVFALVPGSATAAGNAQGSAGTTAPGTTTSLTASLDVGEKYDGQNINTITVTFRNPNYDGDLSSATLSSTNVGSGSIQTQTASQVTVELDSAAQVQRGDTVQVQLNNVDLPSNAGYYSYVVSIAASSAEGSAASTGIEVGSPDRQDLSVSGDYNTDINTGVDSTGTLAAGTDTDTVTQVGDSIYPAVRYDDTPSDSDVNNDIVNDTLTVEHYVDGRVVNQVRLTDGNDNGFADAELSAARDGELRFFDGSELIDVERYSATNHQVQVTSEVIQGTTETISPSILEYNGTQAIPEDDLNIDYAIYEPERQIDSSGSTVTVNKNAGNEIDDGDTSNGEFQSTRTFDVEVPAGGSDPRNTDIDYPADGESSPSYEIFVNDDPDTNNDNLGSGGDTVPDSNSGNNAGSENVPIVLDTTVTSPDAPTFGETRDVNGSIQDGSGSGVQNFVFDVVNPDDGTTPYKIKSATTAGNGDFGFTLTFDDAGNWTYGTDIGDVGSGQADFIQYGSISSQSQQASLDLTTSGTARANFLTTFNIQLNDSVNDNPIDLVNPGEEATDSQDDKGYLNVTGPFDEVDPASSSSQIIAEGNEIDTDGDGTDDATAWVHVTTDANGQASFDLTPLENSVTAELENNDRNYGDPGSIPADDLSSPTYDSFGGAEDQLADTPNTPDYVGSDTVTFGNANPVNINQFQVEDGRTANFDTANPTDDPVTSGPNNADAPSFVINDVGNNDSGPEVVEVLPLADAVNQRTTGELRLGNDQNRDFSGITVYRTTFTLEDETAAAITPTNSNDGRNLTSISVTGAGVNGSVVTNPAPTAGAPGTVPNNIDTDLSEDNIAFYHDPSGSTSGGDYVLLTRPTEADQVDEEISIDVTVESGDSATRDVSANGLFVSRFQVDGDTVGSINGSQTLDLSAQVQNPGTSPTFVNNGRVNVSQRQDTNSGIQNIQLDSTDARTASVNNGSYGFDNVQVGPRGLDGADDDGIAEEVSQLVFTAYQYQDADSDNALDRTEVNNATVQTLPISLNRNLEVDYDAANTSTYSGDLNGNFTLTAGVEYERIAFELTNTETNEPVNLTAGLQDNRVPLDRIGNAGGSDEERVFFIDSDGEQHSVLFNDSASRPDDGYYVIEDIEADDESASGGAGNTDGVNSESVSLDEDDSFMFDSSEVPNSTSTYRLSITDPTGTNVDDLRVIVVTPEE